MSKKGLPSTMTVLYGCNPVGDTEPGEWKYSYWPPDYNEKLDTILSVLKEILKELRKGKKKKTRKKKK